MDGRQQQSRTRHPDIPLGVQMCARSVWPQRPTPQERERKAAHTRYLQCCSYRAGNLPSTAASLNVVIRIVAPHRTPSVACLVLSIWPVWTQWVLAKGR